jgi:CheY-like chemotaxis protein
MKTILIIDDEPSICRMIKSIVESTSDYKATICTNSGEAMEQATKLQPDLILLDVRMPRLSGGEIGEQLRNDPATTNIPFIFLTGMVQRDEVKEGGHKIGGNYYVAKPARKAELMHAIELVLGEKPARPTEEAKPAKEKTVHVAELLGHKIKIKRDSDGYFQMSILGLKSVKGGITFSSLREAQEGAHALTHFHVEKVQHCTCNDVLEWSESER